MPDRVGEGKPPFEDGELPPPLLFSSVVLRYRGTVGLGERCGLSRLHYSTYIIYPYPYPFQVPSSKFQREKKEKIKKTKNMKQ